MVKTADILRAMAGDPWLFLSHVRVPLGTTSGRFGDYMADFQRERFELLVPSVLALVHGESLPHPRCYFEATKGASKDSDITLLILWALAFSRRSLLIQVGAGTQQQASEVRKIAQSVLRLNPWLRDRVSSVQWRIDCDGTDSVCEIIASAELTSHGSRPDWVFFDELSHCPSEDFFLTCMDNASKVPNGLVTIASNAGAVGSWQHTFRENVLVDDYWTTHIFDKPAPWVQERELEQARKRNSKSRFLKLWYGIWAGDDEAAITPDDIADMTTLPGPCPEGPTSAYCVRVAGLDLGIKNDRTGFAILEGDVDTAERRLVACKSWAPDRIGGQINLQEVEDQIHYACHAYDLAAVCYDPFQAMHIAQRLERRGVNMIEIPFTSKSLDEMTRHLLRAVGERWLRLYEHEQLSQDLLRLQIRETQVGHYKLTATRDSRGHADLAVSLTIALMGVAYGMHSLTDLVNQSYAPPQFQRVTA